MTATVLHAGPVSALLEGPDLRLVTSGGVELVQRIYVGVRDVPWNTIPAELRDLEVDQDGDGFQVRFVARHRQADMDLEWIGTYSGTADGTIVADMDATALADFSYAKIGFNLHHALPGHVGRPYRAHIPEGELRGVLPEDIAPQELRDGSLTAMFPHFDALTVELDGGVEVRYRFEGDAFEMQDHRNWGDGNYKTYGTPLSFGYPRDIAAGERLHQRVTISLAGAPAPPARLVRSHRVELGEVVAALPAVGLGMASHDEPLSTRERRLLTALAPAHLRMDLYPGREPEPTWAPRLRAAAELGAELELALFLTDAADAELGRLAVVLGAVDVAVARVLVYADAEGFSELRGTTPVELVQRAAARLDEATGGAPVVGGTNQFFVEINRDRPDLSAMDGVAYSLNPQVHAADDRSLVENLAVQGDMVRFLHRLSPATPVHVSPLTLIGRTGPFPAGPPEADGLPGAVDVRQASLLAAAWTVGSLKHLAEGGAASITSYETTGWRGLIETERGSPSPFPSSPGETFPAYHVLAELAGLTGTPVLAARSSDPLAVEALALAAASGLRVLVANLTAETQEVVVGPLPGSGVAVRVLDDTTLEQARRNPEAHRAGAARQHPLVDGELSLALRPHAVVAVQAS